MTRSVGDSLVRLLRDKGPRTRSQLAEELGISRTSVSSEVVALESAGLVAEGPVAPSSGGRRSTTVRLGPAVRLATVSVGESRIRASVLDAGLAGPRPVTVDVDGDAGPSAEQVGQALRTALGADRSVLAVGLSLAPDLRGGGGLSPTGLESALVEELTNVAGGSPVVVEGAARAMARGERQAGLARGLDNVVVVRIGATVTTAAYVDGHLGRGSEGQAGAVGHVRVDEFGPACVCGSSGCLDSFVSVRALHDQCLAAARSGRSPALAAALESSGAIGLPDLAAAVTAGDPVAVQVARDVGRRVGEAVAGLVAFANPSTVVVGGPVAVLGPHLLNEVRGAVYRRAPARLVAGVNVEMSAPGDRAALLGAALAAGDHAFSAIVTGS
ncbi:ROK family transcriptional regulator [Nocardioides plantarum]|uniref:ROK family protein n=1 Tax=Nocardioides plantarum TaxID=29299 RepID=A0ABV5KGF1_9ACTN|nr:ROK family protein [Nocardioides plantarum]